MKTMRKAAVLGLPTLEEVRAYLPSNYAAIYDGEGGIEVVGYDRAGWDLDTYVIPRLASGFITAIEKKGVDA